jgi:hypothetical protein
MSTFMYSDYSLSDEERTLHHQAAVISKKLEAYHACKSRDEKAWIEELRKLLVYSYCSITLLS